LVYFDTLAPHFYELIQPTRSTSDRQWGLCIFDDVIQFTGANSHRYSNGFLSHMTESLADPSPEVSFSILFFLIICLKIRQAAAYGFEISVFFYFGLSLTKKSIHTFFITRSLVTGNRSVTNYLVT
jgi:hypothetical protein